MKYIALLLLAAAMSLPACKDQHPKETTAKEGQTYTCSMHPQIVREEPGNCPICGMALVAFDKNEKETSVTLSESQLILANISTTVVGDSAFSSDKVLNGMLIANPQQTTAVSSRVAGRIEALYVKQTGIAVKKGQPLYKIYGEELASLQQEYLLAAAQTQAFPQDERFRQIEQGARQKLNLYDLSAAQISQLLSTGKVDPFITYRAPASGVVSELMVTEGQYIAEGGIVMQLEDYDRLWAEATIYPSEAALVHPGQLVRVVVPGWENEPQQMKVQFINPVLEENRQLIKIRGTISNPDNRWQPGQEAIITLMLKSEENVLTLPVDAVIRTENNAYVWIEKSPGNFEPRMIKTGMENENRVEITDGLQPGEKVVTSGTYLLNSEFLLKKGSDPMAGMTM